MRVVVGISGGLDSSVAARLLAREGHEVVGACLRFSSDGGDVDDARRAAGSLGIPLRVLDASAGFEERVVGSFLSDYSRGRTPNPCVVCNPSVKFARLLRLSRELGFDAVATGHYARRDGDGSLLRAADRARDQSYFLCRLPRDALERSLFPVGGLARDEVRSVARTEGLFVRGKRSSQDACFLPPGGLEEFLRSRMPGAFREGEIVDGKGRVLGTHAGFARYTVGQRSGLGLSLGERAYVLRVLARENRVVIGKEEELYARNVLLADVALRGEAGNEFRALVKLRYRHPGADALVRVRGDGAEVTFEEPQRAPAPGQTAALYSGERVLGCGTIAEVRRDG